MTGRPKNNAKKPKDATPLTRIILVDDHPIVREGLCRTITESKTMTVVGEAEDATAGLALFLTQKPDLAIVDISLPGKSGLDLIKDVRARGLHTRILVLSVHGETTYAERALHAGADGYVLKQEAPHVITDAIERVMSGEVYVSPRIAPKLLARIAIGRPSSSSDSPVASLSDRELDVLERVGRGLGTRETAAELGVSVSTVETHRANIKIKLGLSSAPALYRFAAEWVMSQP